MIYAFACDGCSQTVDIERPMEKAGDPAYCLICTAPMRRLWVSATHGDEIRGTSYTHPKTGKTVKDHGKYFDIGGGFWVHSKAERRKMIKERGLIEHGTKQV